MQDRSSGFFLSASGIAFALFPLLRPWGDKSGIFAEQRAAFADPLWVLAHVLGMLAWVLLSYALLVGTTSKQSALKSAATLPGAYAWLGLTGTILLLPYYGAETFGLHAVANSSSTLEAADEAVDAAQELIRSGLLQTFMFAVGFLLLSIALIRAALRERSWRAAIVAVGVISYLPQFFFVPELRIAHGLILGAGCILWAIERMGPWAKAKGRNPEVPA